MSLFSISEHVVHAATISVSAIGAMIVSYLALMYPAAFLQKATTSEPISTQDTAITHRKASVLARTCAIGIFLLLAFSFAIDTLPLILQEGVTPETLASVFCASAMAFFVTQKTLRTNSFFWIYPAFIAAILAPVALGQWRYEVTVKESVPTKLDFGSRRMVVAPVYLGNGRGIFRSRSALYLLSYDGQMALRLSAKLPTR